MKLVSVYDLPDRADILYRLLEERDGTVNISHRNMPCLGDHIRFVESRPYQDWCFIVEGDNVVVGSIYLSHQNEIGVFIFKGHQGKHYGRTAILALMQKHGDKRYLANMNPLNTRSRFLFSGLGFKKIQDTYALG
jgi:RimJ/RimL family protein N-acetyltransferase